MLNLTFRSPVVAQNAGICETSGAYKHTVRRINTHELIFVRDGHLELFEGEDVFRLEKNHYLVLQPFRQHGGIRTVSERLFYYWIHFTVMTDTHAEETPHAALKLRRNGVAGRPDHLTELFRRFLDDQESHFLKQNTANTLLQLLLLELIEGEGLDEENNRTPDALANRALAYIRSNISGELSTASIARAQHCNPDYLGRVFKQTTGMTLTQCIHKQRIAMSRNLLLNRQLKIDQVARYCGFTDTTYFRRVFLTQVGMSPGAFRRLYVKQHVTREIRVMD